MTCEAGLALEVQKPVTAMRNRTDARAAFTRKLHCCSFCLRNASLDACLGQQSLLETKLLKSAIQAFKKNHGDTDLPHPDMCPRAAHTSQSSQVQKRSREQGQDPGDSCLSSAEGQENSIFRSTDICEGRAPQ